MFPISDSIKSKHFPFLTLFFIAVNVYVFFKELVAPNTEGFIYAFSLIPSRVDLRDYTTLFPFVSAMFLHGGFLHIISNMWFLMIFGDNVESFFGKFRYVFVYLVSGIAGNVLQYLLYPNSAIPMLGASGAVSGVLGAYYVLYPHSRIKTLLPIFFFITIVEIPAVIYLFYWFFIQLLSGVASLPIATQTGGVAFWAHVGGFVAGIFFARMFQKERGKGYIEGEIV